MDLKTLKIVCSEFSCQKLSFFGIFRYPNVPFILRTKRGFALMYKISSKSNNIAHLILVISNGINRFYYIDTFGTIPSQKFRSLMQSRFPAYHLFYSKTKLQKYNNCYCSLILLHVLGKTCKHLLTYHSLKSCLDKAILKTLKLKSPEILIEYFKTNFPHLSGNIEWKLNQCRAKMMEL